MSRLDQFIKDKLRSHTTPVDTDQLWKDIQKKKRKRRGFFFLWWGIGVLGVLAVIFLIWNNMNSNRNTIHETSLKPDIQTNYSDTINSRQDIQNSLKTIKDDINEKVITESLIKTSDSNEQITMAKNEKANATNKNTIAKEMEKSVSHTNNNSGLDNAKRNSKKSTHSPNNKVTNVVSQGNLNSSSKSKQIKSSKSETNKLIAQAPTDWNSVAGNAGQNNKDKVMLKILDSVTVSKESKVIAVVAPVNIDDKANLDHLFSGNDTNQVISKNDQSDSDKSVLSRDSKLVKNNTEPITKQLIEENKDSLLKVKFLKTYKPYFINFAFGMSKVNRIFQWDSSLNPTQNKALYAFNISSSLRREIYKGICWYGGINYNRIVLKSQYAQLIFNDSATKQYRYEYIDINGLSTIRDERINTTEITYNIYTHFQRINTLDFQLGLAYHKSFGRWSPIAQAGIAYNMITITTGKAFNNTSQIYYYKNDIRTNVAMSYVLGLGAEYSIDSKNRIGIGSQFQSYLNSFLRDNQVTNKFSLWSAQISYTYKF